MRGDVIPPARPRHGAGTGAGRPLLLACLVGLSGALGDAEPAHAQSVRISGSSSLQYVEVRPFVRDSVPAGEPAGSGLLRQAPDGRVVRCLEGDTFCRGTQPGPTVSTIPGTQDLEVSAWGLGEGVRVFAHVRGRAGWGGNPDLWPRAEDNLDFLAAYGELDRERFRVRVGRQWQSSGLGFYNFDGAAVRIRPVPQAHVEGYLGRSLVRGLNEPRTSEAIQAIEELAPDDPGLLMGLRARYRPSRRVALSALYHRDIRRDRGGLYSELAAADGVFRFGSGSAEASVEVDVASVRLNEARLLVRSPPFRRMSLRGEVRRYRPYFELWTIWGAFSPVGFDEGRLELTRLAQDGRFILRGRASYRRYEDTGRDGGGLGDFRNDAWGVGARAEWRAAARWQVEGAYRMEVGVGAARSEGHGALVRQLGELGFVSLRASAFQRLYEFRLDEGTVLGLGAQTSLALSDRTRLSGGISAYRHLGAGEAPNMDWTQLRGNVRLRWTVGSEPALPGEAGGSSAPSGGGDPGGDR